MNDHAVHDAVNASAAAAKPSRSKRVGRFFTWYIGWDRLKKNGAIVKERMSMPLLRRVMSSSKAGYVPRPAEDVSDELLHKSIKGHTIILGVVIPALLWTLMNIGRGFAIFVDYGLLFTNDYLLVSVPLLVFLTCRLIISAKSIAVFRDEIATRDLQGRRP